MDPAAAAHHLVTCPLCGFGMTAEQARSVCQTCPLARGCRLLRCPRCAYEWVESSRLVEWMRRAVRSQWPTR